MTRPPPMAELIPLALACFVAGCSHCDDTIERANEYLAAHRACQSDDDCQTADVACLDSFDSYCGQTPINREGAASAEWQEISADLRDCTEYPCGVCTALLIPSCAEGYCGGPP